MGPDQTVGLNQITGRRSVRSSAPPAASAVHADQAALGHDPRHPLERITPATVAELTFDAR